MTRPLLLGHRGARANRTIPENTIASFDQALADGCDGFEFDVRLTADGEAVVCHDPVRSRVEIGRAQNQELANLPRLQDVLSRYAARAFLDIELKVSGLERITPQLMAEHHAGKGFVVSSFLTEVLDAILAKDPAVPLGLICETEAQLRAWDRLHVEYVIPHHGLVDSELVSLFQDAGKKVLVWTVNSAAEMRKFAEWGVDGIISDDTGLLCRTIR